MILDWDDILASLLVLDGYLSPASCHEFLALDILLAVLVLQQLGLDHLHNLGDGFVLVLDDLLLLDEENVVVKDEEEQAHIGDGSVHASIGQLGTPLQDFMDAVRVSLSQI